MGSESCKNIKTFQPLKKHLYISLCFLLASSSLKAQFLNNGGDIDKQSFNFGFSLGLNFNRFIIDMHPGFMEGVRLSNGTEESMPLKALKPSGKPGFSLGLLVNKKITNNIDLRFTPNIVFADRDIEYIYQGDKESVNKNIRMTNIQLPLLFKFKSNRQGNIRAYFIGGIKYVLDVTSAKKYNKALSDAQEDPSYPDNTVFTDREYLAWEVGVGLDLYYEFFKCSPEIKISRSFNSVLVQDGNLFSAPLKNLFAEMVQFTIHFE